MPTYEYECKSCSHGFEVFQAMSDLPVKDCPECGKEVRRLILGGAGVIFKGSGFYVTDKSKAAESKARGKDKPDASPACASCPAKGDAAACPAAGEASASSDKSESKSA